MSGKWERRGHLWEGLGNPMLQICLPRIYSKGCDSENMFSGLEISKSSDFKLHLNQYDVIHMGMNE